MLTRPVACSDDALRRCLVEHWEVAVTDLRYLPVGFGSHHWAATDAAAERWFVTVDEIEGGGVALRAALETAADLHAAGCDFVVAPVRTPDGAVLARLGDFAVALYPHVAGETYEYGEFTSATHRRAVLDRIVTLHAIPQAVVKHASRDRFAIPYRAALEQALDVGAADASAGPYAAPSAQLLDRSGAVIRGSLAAYDRYVATVDEASRPFVATHGEPHAGNTIRTTDGWVLVDWDTALVAPRERDLWSLVGHDESIAETYAAVTGVTPSTVEHLVGRGTSEAPGG
jgi:spectinomycin phosphotransferase/16S rRNA (guanine(1405)-N(7))-methyltransferase